MGHTETLGNKLSGGQHLWGDQMFGGAKTNKVHALCIFKLLLLLDFLDVTELPLPCKKANLCSEFASYMFVC